MQDNIMKDDNANIKKMHELVAKLGETYKGDTGINFIDAANLPVRDEIIKILDLLTELIFPGYTGKRAVTQTNINFIIGDILCQVHTILKEQLTRAYKYRCRMENCDSGDCAKLAEEVADFLLGEIPKIRELLKGDIKAAFQGDPAAQSYEEIVISYPCITAIATYRIAHELYVKGVPLIPRIMSEYAHMKTGIDINPGATIGKNFFIDHGTGVVIGETAIIGDHVQIYQGVTLGALAPAKGQALRGVKRHPTIEDHVVLYPDATIIGDVTIGKDVVIGSNVWIKESVAPGVTVTTPHPDLVYRERKKENK
jgi:serine O-acetyltransferase